MEESQKARKGDPGAFFGPQWGWGGFAPWCWKSKIWKSPLSGTLFCFKQPLTNTLYCALRFSSRGSNQTKANVSIQRLYTHTINNKGCTHNHLSFWSYVLVYVGRRSYQQFTNDSIQKSKASKYPRSVMNDIKVCLATNWWQLWLYNGRSAECLR